MNPNMNKRIAEAVRGAEMSFWDKIAMSFPEVKSGDFPPDADFAFDHACVQAASTWLEWNLSKEPPIELGITRYTPEEAKKHCDDESFFLPKKKKDYEVPVVAIYREHENGWFISEYADGTFWTLAGRGDELGSLSDCLETLYKELA